jgi:curli biogenesis system outer membrane secretion channel CsgG
MLTVVLAFAAVVSLPACFSANVSPAVVRAKAASDLSCPSDQIQLDNPTGSNWKAKGCGKEATYACSGSNFMSDGMCLRDH